MRRSVIAVAVAVAALVVAGSAASAHPLRNTWMACPPDQTSGGQFTVDSTAPGGLLTVSGRVDPCAQPRGTDVYTIAAYAPDEALLVAWAETSNVVSWHAGYSAEGSSTFATKISVGYNNVQAICLVTGAQSRVHCYEYATTGGEENHPVIGPTIPVTDARVRHDAPLPPASASGPPSCGNCW